MIENISSENCDFQNDDWNNVPSHSEARIVTQEEVNEKIKSNKAPLSKQLEDLTPLLQRISRAHQTILSPTLSTSAKSGRADKSYDLQALKNFGKSDIVENFLENPTWLTDMT